MTSFRATLSPVALAVATLLAAASAASHAQIGGRPAGPGQLPASGATQPAQPSNGVVVGQVVDAMNNRPIGGVVVSLAIVNPPRPPLPPGAALSPAEIAAIQAASTPRRVMTDGSGAFVFHSLAKGSFRLTVEAPGYLPGGFGQSRPSGPQRQIDVEASERRGGLVIKMWAQSSISGTITDESSDPAVGLSVRLVRVTSNGGQRRYVPGLTAQTDDRGVYRFGQLAPGDYLVALPQTITSVPASTVDAYVAALSKPNGATEFTRNLEISGAPMPANGGIRFGDQQLQLSGGMTRAVGPPVVTANGKTYAYATMYYPSAPTAPDATPITLTAGQERSGIDIQMRTVQTVRVSGVVTSPDGLAMNIGVKLLPGAATMDQAGLDSGFETATTSTDPLGNFTFPSVPTGVYTLRVTKVPRPAPVPAPTTLLVPGVAGRPAPPPPPPMPQPPSDPLLWAETIVSVNDTDVSGLTVALRPGARISGRIIFEGSAPQPTADVLQRMTISVSTADGRPNLVNTPTRATNSGQFTTPGGYPPGKYTISASGATSGWFLKSATLGGRNLDEDGLDLSSQDVSGVTITFTDRTTQISGTVRDPAVQRDMMATVFFFPADYTAWLERGMIGRRTRSMSVGGAGAFQTSGMPAGDYLAAAINPEQLTDARDKAFYDALARVATRLTLGDGEKKWLDLTVSPIR